MAPAPAPSRSSRPTPVVKPAKIRYFKGKAPLLPTSDSDSNDDDNTPAELPKPRMDKNVVAGGAGRVIPQGTQGGGMKVALRDVKVEGGRVLLGGKDQGEEDEDEDDDDEEETDDEEEEEEVKAKVRSAVAVIKPPGGDEVCLFWTFTAG
jgi:microfibrillar-associated protein 1